MNPAGEAFMSDTAVGLRIKERRKTQSLTQAELARKIGISTSYLNLIENGKRSVGGRLLGSIAAALQAPRSAFDDAGDRRMVEALREIAVDPLVRDIAPDPTSATDLLGRHAAWAQTLIALHRSWRERDRAASALADRLNQDPALSDAVHRILGSVSAIRSTAEILASVSDIDPAQQANFHSVLADESGRLSDLSRALAGFFDNVDDRSAALTPGEEVDDFIAARHNHFPEIEAAVEDLRKEARLEPGRTQSRLVDFLSEKFGVVVRRRVLDDLEADEDATFEPIEEGSGQSQDDPPDLLLSETAPESTRRFQIARRTVQLAAADAIESEIARAPELRSSAAKARARRALTSYGAGAALMGYEPYFEAAESSRYDIDGLARRFIVSFEQAAHRMATLRRSGAEGPPLAFMRVDPSGFVTKRLALPGMPLPRIGGACPLWVVYRAFQTPETIVRQLVEFPSGERFLLFARAVSKEGAAYDRPRHLLSVMLATPAVAAERFVYSDGLALGARSHPTPVGPSCRLCVRAACAYRQEDAPMSA